ncbi:MAG: hypothetical protein EOP05_10975, partial [Proteobacteria bacterium]
MRTEIPGTKPKTEPESKESLIELIAREAETFESVQNPLLDQFVDRIGNARVVLLGESTHGTAEFYTLRAEITKRLAREKGFNLVALEADWPDMENVNEYVHSRKSGWSGFSRFPEWMWRNHQFGKFVSDLRRQNKSERFPAVSVFGLDVYSLASSLTSVIKFLEEKDPEAAKAAREAQDCFHPWLTDPAKYGLSVWRQQTESCRENVMELL